MPTLPYPPRPVADPPPTAAAPVIESQAVVTALDEHVASIEMLDGGAERIVPRSLLPDDVALDSVLTFAGSGVEAQVIAHRPPAPSVEDRLSRSLNRQRLHLS
jgi:hypothetical protein